MATTMGRMNGELFWRFKQNETKQRVRGMGFTPGVKSREDFMEEALEGMQALKNEQRRGLGWEALRARRCGGGVGKVGVGGSSGER